jgi:hypothetical protein
MMNGWLQNEKDMQCTEGKEVRAGVKGESKGGTAKEGNREFGSECER